MPISFHLMSYFYQITLAIGTEKSQSNSANGLVLCMLANWKTWKTIDNIHMIYHNDTTDKDQEDLLCMMLARPIWLLLCKCQHQ